MFISDRPHVFWSYQNNTEKFFSTNNNMWYHGYSETCVPISNLAFIAFVILKVDP